ncbi:hypothetical protein [Methylomonas koyamae]|uniref:hypothetical protein n=1 Tax=Methylomonas koyamae TaxID=702114 RepID=UPI00112926AD|nr:hypothetical protein [Methylomonas koyamae]
MIDPRPAPLPLRRSRGFSVLDLSRFVPVLRVIWDGYNPRQQRVRLKSVPVPGFFGKKLAQNTPRFFRKLYVFVFFFFLVCFARCFVFFTGTGTD